MFLFGASLENDLALEMETTIDTEKTRAARLVSNKEARTNIPSAERVLCDPLKCLSARFNVLVVTLKP